MPCKRASSKLLFFTQLLPGQEGGRGGAGGFLKKRRKAGGTGKPHRKAGFCNAHASPQVLFCFLYPHRYQVLMGRPAVQAFEKPDEMKFGKIGCPGNGIEVYIGRVVGIDKSFCFYGLLADVLLWINLPGEFYYLLVVIGHPCTGCHPPVTINIVLPTCYSNCSR